MLRLPICGFARRVEDTVERAMAILNTHEDYTGRRPVGPPALAPRSRRPGPKHED